MYAQSWALARFFCRLADLRTSVNWCWARKQASRNVKIWMSKCNCEKKYHYTIWYGQIGMKFSQLGTETS